MFIKLSVFLLCLQIVLGEKDNSDWELAVVIKDRIELLLSNGTLIGTKFKLFNNLKALTYDNVRHQFVVSDMNKQNDTIFAVKLTTETESPMPIIEDLPDDVQGLTIDPIEDILYWTDSMNKSINYVNLNDSMNEGHVLISLEEPPRDITIDVCRRFIYWTNSNTNNPSIQRARLNGSNQEIIVSSNLHRPVGIAIDEESQRIFWADMQEGIYYSIESSNLDGTNRKVEVKDANSEPFGIAVDSKYIYWTDTNNNALWRIPKNNKENTMPERIQNFKNKPQGLFARTLNIASLPNCANWADVIKTYNESGEEVFVSEQVENNKCLNGGKLIEKGNCNCPRGFAGKSCEKSLGDYFCVNGDFYMSSLNSPKCRCSRGYKGTRCETDVCENFCLNQGKCSRELSVPTCQCPKGFSGARCEKSDDNCEAFCKENEDDVLVSQNNEIVCKCDGGFSMALNSNMTSLPLLAESGHSIFSRHFQDPEILVMMAFVIFAVVIIIALSGYICSLKKRPRIKKRIIVSKNVTPLTYRPQPTTEQCEITIENCCNMNICETPCFEPPKFGCLQSNNDDKKKLLSNMENGTEDLY